MNEAFDFVRCRAYLQCRPAALPSHPGVVLELSSASFYEDVVGALGRALGEPPHLLRLFRPIWGSGPSGLGLLGRGRSGAPAPGQLVRVEVVDPAVAETVTAKPGKGKAGGRVPFMSILLRCGGAWWAHHGLGRSLGARLSP